VVCALTGKAAQIAAVINALDSSETGRWLQ